MILRQRKQCNAQFLSPAVSHRMSVFGCVTLPPTSSPIVFSSSIPTAAFHTSIDVDTSLRKSPVSAFQTHAHTHTCMCVCWILCSTFPAWVCVTFQCKLCGKTKYSVNAVLHWIKPPAMAKCVQTYEISMHVHGGLCNWQCCRGVMAPPLWSLRKLYRWYNEWHTDMSLRGVLLRMWLYIMAPQSHSSFFIQQDNMIFFLTNPPVVWHPSSDDLTLPQPRHVTFERAALCVWVEGKSS